MISVGDSQEKDPGPSFLRRRGYIFPYRGLHPALFALGFCRLSPGDDAMLLTEGVGVMYT